MAFGRSVSAVIIRDARRGELDAVASLLGEVYHAFQPHFSAEVWPAYLGEIVDVPSRLRDSELIVAQTKDRLVGAVTFYPDAARSGIEHWPEGWAAIRTLAVVAVARHKGLGEALTRECIRRAQGRCARAIGLHTAPFMEAANRLYRRLGFRRSPDFDIGIAEMFIGHSLPPDLNWQAEAFQLNLEDV